MSAQNRDATAEMGERKNPGQTTTDSHAQSQYESPRRPAAERTDAFNMLAWLAEGAVGILDELRHNDLGLSQEFWVHAYAARREGLLAARAFLDHVVAQTDKQKNEQARHERRGNINIDFGNS